MASDAAITRELIEAMRLLTAKLQEFRRSQSEPEIAGQTAAMKVVSTLQRAGAPLTAQQISDQTGLQPGTVRMVLYSSDQVVPHKISPRRVVWGTRDMKSEISCCADRRVSELVGAS